MKKIYWIFFLLQITIGVATAQIVKTDNLLHLAKTAKKDTTAVQLYLDIGDQYQDNDPATAKDWYSKALALSKQIDYARGKIKSLNYYGNIFSILGQKDSAMFYIQQALQIAKATGDSLYIGLGLLNIGVFYGEGAEFTKAIDYCLQGLKVVEGKTYGKIEVQINDRLQVLYMQMNQYDKAIVFGEKAVQQVRQLNMPALLAQSLSNLSMSYSGKKMPEKATLLLTEALTISRELGSTNMESSILLNLANIALEKGDYETVKKYSERSLVLFRQIKSLSGEVTALRALGICYLHQKDFAKATSYAQQAISIAKTNNYKAEYAGAIKLLSNISFATGDLEAGEKYYRESETILTAMIEDVLSEKSADLEKKYETDKKDNQLKLQYAQIQRKNMFNYIFAVGAAILFIILLLSYRTYQQKQKLQQQRISELETQQQLTATEAVLKGEEQERTRLAKDLHDGLGGMLSGIKYSFNTMKGNLIMTPDNAQAFERSMDMLDSSIKEMRRVAHNMMPEALVKFGLDTALKDFCNDINQTGALKVNYQSIGLSHSTIEQTTAITIYRIVQELINNTMKHAAAANAIVQLSQTDGKISITVEDDGKGFDTIILNKTKGIGWSNIQNRVEFLKGKLDVQSKQGNGTSVLIELNA
jgi:signal transduction histidine kinase